MTECDQMFILDWKNIIFLGGGGVPINYFLLEFVLVSAVQQMNQL